MSKVLHLGALALFGCALASPLLAHEDDLKVLHRLPPNNGPGYRNAAPLPSGSVGNLGFDANNMQLLSWVPLNQIDNASTGNDCWGYVSPSGREYAIMGTRLGTAFYDITVPTAPVSIGYVSGTNSLWRDAKVYGEYCYSVSESGDDIQVISLVNADSGSVSLVSTIPGIGSSDSHNVAINEDSGYLYLCGGNGHGIRIYDLNANPAAPTYVTTWSTRYCHDAQIVSYTTGPHAGREIAFLCSGFNGGYDDTGLTILDVTNKANIQVVSQVYWPGGVYSHQGWLSEDRQYFYMGDELDEDGSLPSTTYVIDVSDVDNAFYVSPFDNGKVAITHNLYTHGGLIYAANYTTGLRVFDYASNPLNPTEIAHFDTFSPHDGATFNGLWSCYPYLPSGTIIGSDFESGLFLFRLGDPEVEITVDGPAPTTIDPAGDTMNVTIAESGVGLLNTITPELHIDDGNSVQTYPLTQLFGSTWSVDFPVMTCGSTIEWWVTAEGSSGQVYADPFGAPTERYTSLISLGSNLALTQSMEAVDGWTVGAVTDDATTGIWVLGDPLGTASEPADDHTTMGSMCWFTGQGTGGALGENDVDNGSTTLFSPVYDMSSYTAPKIGYWRWFSNDGNASVDDTLRVEITNNGSLWFPVETVGPTGTGTTGGWLYHDFVVDSIVAPTANIQLRFIAEDNGSGSIVEAAIDDLRITDITCEPPSLGTRYCSPAPFNTTGMSSRIDAIGSSVIIDQGLILIATQLPPNQFGFFLVSRTQGFTANPGGSMGHLCLADDIGRYMSQVMSSGPTGTISLMVDFASIPVNPPVAALIGESWNFQAWHRDFSSGPLSNFSDAIELTFE
tara:strand:+ start:4403 stop:6928 length:2526 start_codon:yes stop_codon:yes gene_type:complete